MSNSLQPHGPHLASLSIRFPRQEYRSGLPFPSPGDLPDPGIKPTSFISPALADGFFTTSTTWDAHRPLLLLLLSRFSRVRLFATLWTVDYQSPSSMEFSRQEQWSGLQVSSPGDLPDTEIESWSPALQADALTSEPPGKPNIA